MSLSGPSMPSSPMPTLCSLAGPLPESYRPFLNPAGDLQVGDAFGLEAQWIIGMISAGPKYPEDEWTMVQIAEDEQGEGCVACGDEFADTTHGLCQSCS